MRNLSVWRLALSLHTHMKKKILALATTVASTTPVFAQTAPIPEAGRWAFNPTRDTFSPRAFVDLRTLNERVAGEKGFVRVDKNGQFVRGDGAPLAFWGVVTDNSKPVPEGSLYPPRDPAHHARFIAKRGVNIARCFIDVVPREHQGYGAPASNDPSQINRIQLDATWKFVANMKKQGIYTLICPYWAYTLKPPKSWGFEGLDGSTDAHNLLFYHPKMQAIYRNWMRILWTEKNPYTGLALKDDPAVAIFQIQNEDSLLFWTVNNLVPEQRQILGTQFGAWLTREYGSLDKAQESWSKNDPVGELYGAIVPAPGDQFEKGVAGFFNIYDFTGDAPKPDATKAARMRDQMEFVGRTMRDFYEGTEKYLRGLGVKCLFNATNWTTADNTVLGDIERWSYGSGEVLAVNRYTGAAHKGEREGWAIQKGDFYQPQWSQLTDPETFPLNLKRTLSQPIAITESSWVLPTRHRAEGSFLVSAYGAMNGIGPFFWFIGLNDEWMPPMAANGYDKETSVKWSNAQPDELGQFPAAALMFRNGSIKRAPNVVVEQRSLEDLWTRRVPIITEKPGFDPNRYSGDIAPSSSVQTFVDPLAYYVGGVRVVYGGDPKKSFVHPRLNSLIDRKNGLVTSATRELVYDFKRGLCKLNAPAAQGIVGFLNGAGGKFSTRDLQIQSSNDYASILVVSVDGTPIKTSKKLLVQVGTRTQPTGWREKPATRKVGAQELKGAEVESIGDAPWQVENTRITLSVQNSRVRSAKVLDENLVPIRNLKIQREKGHLTIQLPPNALYVGLE